MNLAIAAATDVGRVRAANEDSYFVDDELRVLAVADGMGGHQAGEVASATAIAALQEQLAAGQAIGDAIAEANTAVFSRASGDPALRGMGTTMTAAVYDDDTLLIGHVGDSRAYLLRGDTFEQLTVDHSVVAELIAAGQITATEAETDPRRSMITRALGIDFDVAVDVIPVTLAPGDRFLFCSDGLTTMLRGDAIAALLRTERERDAAATALIAAANDAGGADNITVLIADVVGDDASDHGELPSAPAPAAPPDPPDEPAAETTADPTPEESPSDDPEAPRRRWWKRRPH